MTRKASFDRGDWQVQRQRLHLQNERPDPPDRVQPIGRVLPRIMKELGLDADLWRRNLMEQWCEIAGPIVSKHARPGRVEHGVLTVYVAHSIWLQELQRTARDPLLRNLRTRLPEAPIRRLAFRLDPDIAAPARRRGFGGPPAAGAGPGRGAPQG